MNEPQTPLDALLQRIATLERELLKRDKVVEALKSRVKRSIQSSGNAFSTFENNILLSVQIAQQTARLHEATRQAQEANRAKSHFLAMMGQEIRTPMNAIVALSQLALQGALDGPSRAYVTQLHQAAQALLSMVDSMRDYARIETRRLELEPATFVLRQVLSDAVHAVSAQAQLKHIHLHAEVDPALAVCYIGDAQRLRQVWRCLLDNAVKFTDQGSVQIRLGPGGGTLDAPRLHCEVADTGVGMDAVTLQRLFEPFAQADPAVSRRFGGSGLGLVIAHQLVQMLGGELQVHSVVGAGTVFAWDVVLRAAPHTSPDTATFAAGLALDTKGAQAGTSALPAQAAAQPPTAVPVRSRLLLADADRNHLLAMRDVLQGLYALELADQPATLLQLAQQVPQPDLIVLDRLLDGSATQSLCRQLQGLPSTRGIPVIVLSSQADDATESAALALGAVDFLPKPWRPSLLLARVALHLELARQRQHYARLSAVDALTGLPNRRALDEHLAREFGRAVREQRALAVLFVDVDDFKAYNDCYGHAQGDEALRCVARCLRSTISRPGDLIARYGGEEFVCLLPDTAVGGARAIAERILERVRQERLPHPCSRAADHVTVSVGVVVGVPAAPDAGAYFLDQADQQLYLAKSYGRNVLALLELAAPG